MLGNRMFPKVSMSLLTAFFIHSIIQELSPQGLELTPYWKVVFYWS